MGGSKVGSDRITDTLFEDCSNGHEQEGWRGHAPIMLRSSTIAQVMEVWVKAGQQGG